MKKILILSLLLGLLMICGCSKTTGTKSNKESITTKKQGLLSVDEILASSTSSQLKCDKYTLGKYMKPFWDNQIIYNETCMFFEEKDGTIKDKTLIYPISKILEVRNNTLEIVYEEGKDYEVVDGKLRFLAESHIPLMKYENYYLDSPNNPNAVFTSTKEQGKYLVYNEGDFFTKMQVSVTYIRTDEWEGPSIVRDSDKLPNTLDKLKNKKALNIVYYGDSIMEGCNSSQFNKVEPFMSSLSTLITKKLISTYEYDDIHEYNTAVGGWTTNNGIVQEEFQKRVLDKNPDLVVFHFGTNDATFRMDPNTFGSNIQNMMKKVLKQNPNCEFVLVAPILCNIDANNSNGSMRGNIESYLEVFKLLSEENDVALADMTTMSNFIYTKKDFIDITGNNINHPNDFMIRFIAQTIVAQIEG